MINRHLYRRMLLAQLAINETNDKHQRNFVNVLTASDINRLRIFIENKFCIINVRYILYAIEYHVAVYVLTFFPPINFL